jgi:squalene-hopene/tetraprenyl-beta-curcumene cyclase
MKLQLIQYYSNVCLPIIASVSLVAHGADAATGSVPAPRDLSLRNEVQQAIDRGLTWLQRSQDTNGWWTTADHPAVTALALTAFMGDPSRRSRTNAAAGIERGYRFLRESAQPDGSLHRGTLINYNTAISVTALAVLGDPRDEDLLRRARAYLIKSQNDFGELGKVDTELDGGVGYGDKYRHSDMNNTLVALEALRATQHLATDRGDASETDLNWAAAIRFIESCQNLPGRNPATWVSDEPRDRGGFVYYPGHSMAGGTTNLATGKVSLRSYGSISYGGLLSYLYAKLRPEDPRIRAVREWLVENYTLEENPGMGQQGLFYYLHLMTKALHVADTDSLVLADQRVVAWPREVALRLLNLQRPDGSWWNENNRWWERDPNLVTAYSVMALEMIWRRL